MPKASLTMTALAAAAIWIALGVWLPWWAIAVAAAACTIWMVVTPAGRRTGSITAAGIATLPRRLGGASVAVVGIAGVVGVRVALLAMGMRRTCGMVRGSGRRYQQRCVPRVVRT